MLKATCIVGSARANGSCNYLVDSVIRGMQESGIETKKYCIGEMKIQYCCGQKKCYTDGKCVYNDDVKQIVEDMIESDIVVPPRTTRLLPRRDSPSLPARSQQPRMPWQPQGSTYTVRPAPQQPL